MAHTFAHGRFMIKVAEVFRLRPPILPQWLVMATMEG